MPCWKSALIVTILSLSTKLSLRILSWNVKSAFELLAFLAKLYILSLMCFCNPKLFQFQYVHEFWKCSLIWAYLLYPVGSSTKWLPKSLEQLVYRAQRIAWVYSSMFCILCYVRIIMNKWMCTEWYINTNTNNSYANNNSGYDEDF